MANDLEENGNQDEISDPAEALLFIRGVISASRGGKKKSAALEGILEFIVTVAAGVITWWMINNGVGHIWPLWATHNAILLGLMIFFTKRRGTVSQRDRQIIVLWAMICLAMWTTVIPLQLFGALKWWAVFPMIPVFVGLGTIAYGILMWNKFEIAIGALLVLSLPFVIQLKEQGYVAALAVIVAFGLLGTIGETIQLKKLRNAA